MILATHQPNYFPWLPWFQKKEQADIFVILTYCKFSRYGFQNRFHLDGKWFTMPTAHEHDFIKDRQYVEPEKAWNKIKFNLGIIDKKYRDFAEAFDDCIFDGLAKTNMAIIARLTEILEVTMDNIRYDEYSLKMRNDRIIELCHKYNCDQYLAGLGSKEYMDVEYYNENGIEVIWQEVTQAERIPIMSAILDN